MTKDERKDRRQQRRAKIKALIAELIQELDDTTDDIAETVFTGGAPNIPPEMDARDKIGGGPSKGPVPLPPTHKK